jgi:hypothetical protein
MSTPPIASPQAPDGPDVSGDPNAAPGHYGPGYGDSTKHTGELKADDVKTGGAAIPRQPLEPASALGPKDPASPEIAKD